MPTADLPDAVGPVRNQQSRVNVATMQGFLVLCSHALTARGTGFQPVIHGQGGRATCRT